MKSLIHILLFAAISLLSGCANQGQAYARKHPELSAEQRKILVSGKISPGEAVAGLTREQVKVAMGGDPAQFTNIDGADAWVYIAQRRTGTLPLDDFQHSGNSGMGGNNHFTETPNAASDTEEVRTTIFFQGNRATRAEISQGRPQL